MKSNMQTVFGYNRKNITILFRDINDINCIFNASVITFGLTPPSPAKIWNVYQ